MSKIVDFDDAAYSSYSEGKEAVRFTAAGCEFRSHPDVNTMFDGDYGCRPDFYIQGVIVDYKGAVYQDNVSRLIELSRRTHRNLVITGDIPFNCYTLEEYVSSIIETWRVIGSCGYHTYNAWDSGVDRGMVVPVFTKAGKVRYVMGAPQDVDRVCEWLRNHFSEDDLDFTLELARYASGFKNFDYEEDWADEGTVEYKEQMNRIHTDVLHPRNERLTIYPAKNEVNEVVDPPIPDEDINNIENEWSNLADELENIEIKEVEREFEPEAEVDPNEVVEIESDPELDPDFVPGPKDEPEWFGWLRTVNIKVGKNHDRGKVITQTIGEWLYEKTGHDQDKFMETISLLEKSRIPTEKMFNGVYVKEVGTVVCDHYKKYDESRLIAKIDALNKDNINKENYGVTLCSLYDYRKHYDRLSDDLENIREQRFSEVTQDLSLRTGVPVGNVAAILGDSIALGYVSLNLA